MDEAMGDLQDGFLNRPPPESRTKATLSPEALEPRDSAHASSDFQSGTARSSSRSSQRSRHVPQATTVNQTTNPEEEWAPDHLRFLLLPAYMKGKGRAHSPKSSVRDTSKKITERRESQSGHGHVDIKPRRSASDQGDTAAIETTEYNTSYDSTKTARPLSWTTSVDDVIRVLGADGSPYYPRQHQSDSEPETESEVQSESDKSDWSSPDEALVRRGIHKIYFIKHHYPGHSMHIPITELSWQDLIEINLSAFLVMDEPPNLFSHAQFVKLFRAYSRHNAYYFRGWPPRQGKLEKSTTFWQKAKSVQQYFRNSRLPCRYEVNRLRAGIDRVTGKRDFYHEPVGRLILDLKKNGQARLENFDLVREQFASEAPRCLREVPPNELKPGHTGMYFESLSGTMYTWHINSQRRDAPDHLTEHRLTGILPVHPADQGDIFRLVRIGAGARGRVIGDGEYVLAKFFPVGWKACKTLREKVRPKKYGGILVVYEWPRNEDEAMVLSGCLAMLRYWQIHHERPWHRPSRITYVP